jgi:hypothetical protein
MRRHLLILTAALLALPLAGFAVHVLLTNPEEPDFPIADFSGQSSGPRRAFKVLENAPVLEVLSIDPTASTEKESTFRGYRLLGKTTVSDKAARRRVADAMYDSVKQGKASALCFEPRHVVRASANRENIDFVICFECLDMHVHPGPGDSHWHFPISEAAKALLNKILKDAGVPLAQP